MAVTTDGAPVTDGARLQQELIASAFRKAMWCERLGGRSQGVKLAELEEAIGFQDFPAAMAIRDQIREDLKEAALRIAVLVIVVMAVIAAFSHHWAWGLFALFVLAAAVSD